MKIGILGGSFNPVHIGHAMVANYITQYTDIDQVWLMVSPQNPLKTDYRDISDEDRIRMVDMVASKCTNVITSGFEFTLPKPSYTINTLDSLAAKFPQHEFCIIIGSDNWAAFDKWKDFRRIIQDYGVIVYPRKGYLSGLPEIEGNVKMINAPLVEVSSTFIREGLRENRNMNFFLPENVYEFIKSHYLYKQDNH